nr:type II secretion system protein GspM [Ramlibacter albus]
MRARWDMLAAREKLLVAAAAGLVGIALVWWIGIAPALATLRAADEQHRTLDAQLQHMLRLQSQAQAMQGQPKQTQDESMRLLEAAIRQHLGITARYTIQGERVTLTLAGTQPQALAQWLTQVRVNARATPSEVRLARNPAGGWDGTLVVTLPSR